MSNNARYDDRPPSWGDILDASGRIAAFAHRTPVMSSHSINQLAGCEIYFKCENLQRVGAFKFRGACNAVFSLSEAEAAHGVITQSSGNHGAAIALACKLRSISATVVMPENAAKIKINAVRNWGAKVIFCGPGQAARDQAMDAARQGKQANLIHPFNDRRVIAGQATAALELLQDVPDIHSLVAPISGAGLISGCALVAHQINPQIDIIAAEPEGASDAFRSLRSGRIERNEHLDTICDGLRADLGSLTFPIVKAHVRDVFLLSDDETIAAMRLIWDRLKLIVEPQTARVFRRKKSRGNFIRRQR